MSDNIKIIDLFAGPGGLGEGFSAFEKGGKPRFKIALSVEKEESAHRTLTLRSLFRQFPIGSVPEAYYAFMRGDLGSQPEEVLYSLPEFRGELESAMREALKFELGKNSQSRLYRLIREKLAGDDFVLIGGPPCQAYSVVGRSRNYGDRNKEYVPEADNRNFLYREYLRLIAKFQPSVFVMENVKGMISAKVGGHPIINSIFEDLRDPCKALRTKPELGIIRNTYRICSFVAPPSNNDLFSDKAEDSPSPGILEPSDYIIRSEEFGIPQARHRVILLGIREDVGEQVNWNIPRLESGPSKISVAEVIGDLPKLRSRISKATDSAIEWVNVIRGIDQKYLDHLSRDRNLDSRVVESIRKTMTSIGECGYPTGANFGFLRETQHSPLPLFEGWYLDKKLGRYVSNHESRSHIAQDLERYFYYANYAVTMGKSPTSKNLPKMLWPNHENFESGKFADRFRVQLKDLPATTITSHISKDGHYYIHYDPLQCRSLTVREAARIQSFPDNYHFVGSRTEQFVQVGNAVPPLLARQLAQIVSELI